MSGTVLKKAASLFTLVFAIIFIGITPQMAAATDYTFAGLASTCPSPPGECADFVPGQADDWGDGRNWLPFGVPGVGDTATITNFTVKINGTRTVNRLILNNILFPAAKKKKQKT